MILTSISQVINNTVRFYLLLTKCVPMCKIRLILDCYFRQKSCALWNNVKSRYFYYGKSPFFFFSFYI